MVEAEREADEEQVEPDANRRTYIEDAPRFLGKERRRKLGKEEAEERGSDQHARDHLADDLRLAEEFFRGPADGAADEQDDRDLEEEMDAEIGWRVARRRIDRGAVRAKDTADRASQFIEQI